jgi:hypothetical protein
VSTRGLGAMGAAKPPLPLSPFLRYRLVLCRRAAQRGQLNIRRILPPSSPPRDSQIQHGPRCYRTNIISRAFRGHDVDRSKRHGAGDKRQPEHQPHNRSRPRPHHRLDSPGGQVPYQRRCRCSRSVLPERRYQCCGCAVAEADREGGHQPSTLGCPFFLDSRQDGEERDDDNRSQVHCNGDNARRV